MSVAPSGDDWAVTNLAGSGSEACSAEAGTSVATFERLPGRETVTLKASSFSPTLTSVSLAQSMRVFCRYQAAK